MYKKTNLRQIGDTVDSYRTFDIAPTPNTTVTYKPHRLDFAKRSRHIRNYDREEHALGLTRSRELENIHKKYKQN